MKLIIFFSVLFILFSCSILQPTKHNRVAGALYDSEMRIVVVNGDTATVQDIIFIKDETRSRAVVELQKDMVLVKKQLDANSKKGDTNSRRIDTLYRTTLFIDTSLLGDFNIINRTLRIKKQTGGIEIPISSTKRDSLK